MEKARDAFRTISEVASWLETPAHVLRFWESKFNQVKPVKRAGGRRYYRPSDMKLLGGIKKLLHEDGMTIKGVQKILREEGIKKVAAHSQPLHLEDAAAPERDEKIVRFSEPPIESTAEEIETPAARIPDGADDAEAVTAETPQPEPANTEGEPVLADAAAQKSTIPMDLPSETGAPATGTAALEGTEAGLARQDESPTADAANAAKVMAAVQDTEEDPGDEDIDAPPPVAARIRALHPGHLAARRDRIAPLYVRLKSLRGRMGG